MPGNGELRDNLINQRLTQFAGPVTVSLGAHHWRWLLISQGLGMASVNSHRPDTGVIGRPHIGGVTRRRHLLLHNITVSSTGIYAIDLHIPHPKKKSDR